MPHRNAKNNFTESVRAPSKQTQPLSIRCHGTRVSRTRERELEGLAVRSERARVPPALADFTVSSRREHEFRPMRTELSLTEIACPHRHRARHERRNASEPDQSRKRLAADQSEFVLAIEPQFTRLIGIDDLEQPNAVMIAGKVSIPGRACGSYPVQPNRSMILGLIKISGAIG